MRITRWGEYGVLCCIYLAQRHRGGAVGAAEIAKSQSIPLKYAQQILHRLRRGGVIKSVRGPHGGFLLSRDPQSINLRQIMEAAEGGTFCIICEAAPLSHPLCSAKGECQLAGVWQDMKVAVDKVLESRSVASLMNGSQPKTGSGAAIRC